jgi:hypothetical protein
MTPIKFIKQKDNYIDFDVMTLVNIVTKGNNFYYFFLCEYEVEHNGIVTKECDLIEFNEENFMDIELNYKISKN